MFPLMVIWSHYHHNMGRSFLSDDDLLCGQMDGIIFVDPLLDLHDGILRFCVADDDALQSGVDDRSAAHGAGGGVAQELSAVGVTADEIQCRTDAFIARSGDDGICFCVDAPAKLIAFSAGDLHLLSDTVTKLTAVCSASGCAVIAGGDDLIVSHDDSTVMPAKASGTLQNSLCDVKVVVFFVDSLHDSDLLLCVHAHHIMYSLSLQVGYIPCEV